MASLERILIVDDERFNINVLVHFLEPEFETMVAKSGEQALKRARSEQPPSLILLDIKMHDMDGYEVCRRLKADEKTKDIPIIFVTVMEAVEEKTKGFDLGAVDYITKPINLPVLQARVRAHLKIRSLNRALHRALAEQERANDQLQRANQFIRKTFGSYMSDEVVETILDTPEGLQLGGENRVVTVMMSDLRGFTAIGERFPPEDVITMLNIYLEAMTEIILKYNGTIIEFLGDGILTLFGAPTTREDDAQRAVACALAMQSAMPAVNAKNQQRGFPPLSMGVGINTGHVVAGNIGSDLRRKYGVVGKVINLTARIESLTVGDQIFISENTFQECHPLLQFEEQWSVNLKGIPHPMTIYQITGIEGPHRIHLTITPKPVVYKTLDEGLSIRLTVWQEKWDDNESYPGKMTAIDLPLAVVITSLKARRFSTIKIDIFDADGVLITDQLYGKVVETGVNDSVEKISFTSIPPEALDFFGRLQYCVGEAEI